MGGLKRGRTGARLRSGPRLHSQRWISGGVGHTPSQLPPCSSSSCSEQAQRTRLGGQRRRAYAGADSPVLMAKPRFARMQQMVERWGAPVVALSFLTVGIQTLVNLAAGVMRMPLRRYLPALTVGAILWAFLYATVGFATFAALAAGV